MAATDDYTKALQALLPEGAIWTREPEAVLTRVLAAEADELARADARLDDLRDEADPRTAWEAMSDWERVCGLPDVCSEVGESMAARRAAVLAKLAGRGGQSRAYYIELAAAHGYEVTITEFRPSEVGVLAAGDEVAPAEAAHSWRVNAAAETIHALDCNGSCTDRLRWWGNERLECVISQHAPAHTLALFGYGGEA